MSNVKFIGDLHFGHLGIHKFRTEFSSYNDYLGLVIENLFTNIDKRDIVYYMGDICFDNSTVEIMKELPGRKILVRGNHDDADIKKLMEVFDDIHGITKYRGHWLSHCPIHPSELWGKPNIHGHVHFNTVLNDHGEIDPRYVNVSAENINYTPITFNAIKYWIKHRSEGADIHLMDHEHFPV
jgi:calcineurin-like phosphoesterase family protein